MAHVYKVTSNLATRTEQLPATLDYPPVLGCHLLPPARIELLGQGTLTKAAGYVSPVTGNKEKHTTWL